MKNILVKLIRFKQRKIINKHNILKYSKISNFFNNLNFTDLFKGYNIEKIEECIKENSEKLSLETIKYLKKEKINIKFNKIDFDSIKLEKNIYSFLFYIIFCDKEKEEKGIIHFKGYFENNYLIILKLNIYDSNNNIIFKSDNSIKFETNENYNPNFFKN
jgi:hypothetical protein